MKYPKFDETQEKIKRRNSALNTSRLNGRNFHPGK